MNAHDLKCWPEPFQAIKDGRKTFEFRRNDRDYQSGDVLRLREYDPNTQAYSGDMVAVMVTYILDNGFGLPDGYVIMSIKRVADLRLD